MPSCVGLNALDTPPVFRTSFTFTGRRQKVGRSFARLTLGTVALAAPITFPVSGPVLRGAFAGETATATAVLDLGLTDLATACAAPGGLTSFSFTGVMGSSGLDVYP
jgi:hypothetical protein